MSELGSTPLDSLLTHALVRDLDALLTPIAKTRDAAERAARVARRVSVTLRARDACARYADKFLAALYWREWRPRVSLGKGYVRARHPTVETYYLAAAETLEWW
jgi:hypothetical protein